MPLRFEESRLDEPDAAAGPLRGAALSAGRLRSARTVALEAGLDALGEDGRPRSFVVVGSGTDGLTGDMVRTALGFGCPVPVHTVRDGRLPGWVGGYDLVAAVATGSGHGAETTVRAAGEAVRRGCRFLAVGAPEGPLAPIAAQGRGPYVALPDLPGDADAPALAAPWGPTAALVTAAGEAGLTRVAGEVHEAAAQRLEDAAQRYRPDVETWENPAKGHAVDLAGTLPVVWGTTPLTGFAARYLADRLAAVARYPALCAPLSEALHGQVAALHGPFGGSEPRSIFDDPVEDERVRLRLLLVRDTDTAEEEGAEGPGDAEGAAGPVRDAATAAETAEACGVPVSETPAEGGHEMERMAGLLALSDYVSVYLAVAYGVDPRTHTLVVR